MHNQWYDISCATLYIIFKCEAQLRSWWSSNFQVQSLCKYLQKMRKKKCLLLQRKCEAE